MQHSLSDVWQQLMSTMGTKQQDYYRLAPYIYARRVGRSMQMVVQACCNNVKVNKTYCSTNVLAFANSFKTAQAFVKDFLAEHEQAKQQAAAQQIKSYLETKREEYARIAEEKRKAEEARRNIALRHVRPMVQAVLDRYKPVIDQFAYTNVYGRPVEKVFY